MGVVKQILHLPENVFYQTIYHFQVSWAASASAFLDSALIYGQSATPRLAEHLSITRLFSTIVNGGWLACEAIELFRALQGYVVWVRLFQAESVYGGHLQHQLYLFQYIVREIQAE